MRKSQEWRSWKRPEPGGLLPMPPGTADSASLNPSCNRQSVQRGAHQQHQQYNQQPLYSPWREPDIRRPPPPLYPGVNYPHNNNSQYWNQWNAGNYYGAQSWESWGSQGGWGGNGSFYGPGWAGQAPSASSEKPRSGEARTSVPRETATSKTTPTVTSSKSAASATKKGATAGRLVKGKSVASSSKRTSSVSTKRAAAQRELPQSPRASNTVAELDKDQLGRLVTNTSCASRKERLLLQQCIREHEKKKATTNRFGDRLRTLVEESIALDLLHDGPPMSMMDGWPSRDGMFGPMGMNMPPEIGGPQLYQRADRLPPARLEGGRQDITNPPPVERLIERRLEPPQGRRTEPPQGSRPKSIEGGRLDPPRGRRSGSPQERRFESSRERRPGFLQGRRLEPPENRRIDPPHNRRPDPPQDKRLDSSRTRAPDVSQERRPESAQARNADSVQERRSGSAQARKPDSTKESRPDSAQDRRPDPSKERRPDSAQARRPEPTQARRSDSPQGRRIEPSQDLRPERTSDSRSSSAKKKTECQKRKKAESQKRRREANREKERSSKERFSDRSQDRQCNSPRNHESRNGTDNSLGGRKESLGNENTREPLNDQTQKPQIDRHSISKAKSSEFSIEKIPELCKDKNSTAPAKEFSKSSETNNSGAPKNAVPDTTQRTNFDTLKKENRDQDVDENSTVAAEEHTCVIKEERQASLSSEDAIDFGREPTAPPATTGTETTGTSAVINESPVNFEFRMKVEQLTDIDSIALPATESQRPPETTVDGDSRSRKHTRSPLQTSTPPPDSTLQLPAGISRVTDEIGSSTLPSTTSPWRNVTTDIRSSVESPLSTTPATTQDISSTFTPFGPVKVEQTERPSTPIADEIPGEEDPTMFEEQVYQETAFEEAEQTYLATDAIPEPVSASPDPSHAHPDQSTLSVSVALIRLQNEEEGIIRKVMFLQQQISALQTQVGVLQFHQSKISELRLDIVKQAVRSQEGRQHLEQYGVHLVQSHLRTAPPETMDDPGLPDDGTAPTDLDPPGAYDAGAAGDQSVDEPQPAPPSPDHASSFPEFPRLQPTPLEEEQVDLESCHSDSVEEEDSTPVITKKTAKNFQKLKGKKTKAKKQKKTKNKQLHESTSELPVVIHKSKIVAPSLPVATPKAKKGKKRKAEVQASTKRVGKRLKPLAEPETKVAPAKKLVWEFFGHREKIVKVMIYKSFLFSCSVDGTVKMFKLLKHSGIPKIQKTFMHRSNSVFDMDIAPLTTDTSCLIVASSEGTLQKFSMPDGDHLGMMSTRNPITCFCMQWGLIYVGDQEGCVTLHKVSNLRVLKTFPVSDTPTLCLATTSEGGCRILLTGSEDGSITLRDARSGVLLRCLSADSRPPLQLLVANEQVFSRRNSGNGMCRDLLMQAVDGNSMEHIKQMLDVTGFTIDGNRLYMSSRKGLVRVMDLNELVARPLYYGVGNEPITAILCKDKLLVTANASGKMEAFFVEECDVFYVCKFGSCRNPFVFYEDLTRHVELMHASPPPDACLVPGCGASFVAETGKDAIEDRKEIVTHILLHSEQST